MLIYFAKFDFIVLKLINFYTDMKDLNEPKPIQ